MMNGIVPSLAEVELGMKDSIRFLNAVMQLLSWFGLFVLGAVLIIVVGLSLSALLISFLLGGPEYIRTIFDMFVELLQRNF